MVARLPLGRLALTLAVAIGPPRRLPPSALRCLWARSPLGGVGRLRIAVEAPAPRLSRPTAQTRLAAIKCQSTGSGSPSPSVYAPRTQHLGDKVAVAVTGLTV